MPTTLTLDDDLADALREQAQRTDQPLEQVVNDTLRRGLSPTFVEMGQRYRVRPHQSGFRTGIDPMRLNQLNDSFGASGLPGPQARWSSRT